MYLLRKRGFSDRLGGNLATTPGSSLLSVSHNEARASAATRALRRSQLLSAFFNVCLVRRTPLLGQRAVRSVCPDPRALSGVSLIPLPPGSSLFFFPPRCYVLGQPRLRVCMSFGSLKVMLVKRDITLFTLLDVRLRCCL